jgi:hypothetical protein
MLSKSPTRLLEGDAFADGAGPEMVAGSVDDFWSSE